MPIKVRVGQSDAIKILASAGGGSINAQTAKNVIGGIASVTQLSVSGISTLGNVEAGIITATSFVGPLTGDVVGNLTGNLSASTTVSNNIVPATDSVSTLGTIFLDSVVAAVKLPLTFPTTLPVMVSIAAASA